jgi:hypothetical protein
MAIPLGRFFNGGNVAHGVALFFLRGGENKNLPNKCVLRAG